MLVDGLCLSYLYSAFWYSGKAKPQFALSEISYFMGWKNLGYLVSQNKFFGTELFETPKTRRNRIPIFETTIVVFCYWN
jgi:hypothetical protein